jgi:signal transduction histidine kinase
VAAGNGLPLSKTLQPLTPEGEPRWEIRRYFPKWFPFRGQGLTAMRHRLSIFLMTASLVLLAVFLVFFLKKTWQDELDQLKKETAFLFASSIHSIEGELLDKLVMRRMTGSSSEPGNVFLFKNRRVEKDSVKVMAIIDGQEMGGWKDSTVSVKIHARETGGGAEMSGSLSMVIAMSGREGDSLIVKTNGKDVLPVLQTNFEKAVKTAGLPVGYRIVRWPQDSLAPGEATLTGSYFDLSSGEKYAVELSAYSGYVFRQMWLQVLFSVVLFVCVALAFFTIFKSLREQYRLTELKNDFIQNMTHELKTPIATVGVAIEALQNFDALQNPERTREYLDISRGELGRLSLLVDKVLRMSQFEKAVPELKLETLDLEALTGEVLASMKLQFEKAGAEVNFETSGSGCFLEGDRLHLASVVYNLLDNALKYSPGRPVITVGMEQVNGQIYLRIGDNGTGIPQEYQDRIFEKFFRVPAGAVHNVKGHGLGLSYVASVVQKHRGRIEVEKNEPQGTVFKIILPQTEKRAA